MNDPVTVFIVHWNRPEQCRRTVESFLQQSYPCRVIVIDNASKPEFKKILMDSFSDVNNRVDFIWNRDNLGFAGALAPVIYKWAQNSREPACIIAAHDVCAERGAVEALMEVLLSEPKVGIAFPINNPPERGFWDPIRGAHLYPVSELECEEKIIHGMWFPEHCIAIKREIVRKGINFDSRLFAYFEGVDLSLSVRKLGFHTVLVTGALIENTESGGSARGSVLIPYLLARNSVLVAYKHSGRIAAVLRAIYILVASLKSWITGPGKKTEFSSKTRIRGVIDALRGRYGQPPEDLI